MLFLHVLDQHNMIDDRVFKPTPRQQLILQLCLLTVAALLDRLCFPINDREDSVVIARLHKSSDTLLHDQD